MSSEPERIAWRVHPMAERRVVGIAVLAAILLLSILAGVWMGSAYWGLFAFVILFLSLEAFFLPSRFELNEEGVEVHKPFSNVSRPWAHFRRVVFDPLGVTLSPFGRRHWLDTYRAVRLRFSARSTSAEGTSRRDVERFVLAHLDAGQVCIEGAESPGRPGGEE